MDEKSRSIQKRLAAGSDFLKIASGSGADLYQTTTFGGSAASENVTNVGFRGTLFFILKKMLCSGSSFDKKNARSCLNMPFNCSK